MNNFMYSRHTKRSCASFDENGICTSLYDGSIEEITVGVYPGGGTEGAMGEFTVTWSVLECALAPKLNMYDDSWHLLRDMRPLFDKMIECADGYMSPNKFEEMLVNLGYDECPE